MNYQRGGGNLSQSAGIEPNFDCSYHFSIYLEPNGIPYGVLNQSEHGNYNQNLV